MKERFVDIPTGGGPMPAFVVHPEENGPFPAVILYMDIWGLREELFDIARRVAAVGYYGVVPDLYHRQGRVRAEFRDAAGRMISLERLDPARRQGVLAPMLKLADAQVVEDTGALVRFLAEDAAAATAAMGAIGYCMGGRHVLLAAGHYPENFRASASLHGTRLVSADAGSAHLLAERFRGELYCGFAERDPYAPMATIAALAAALDGRAVGYRHEIHAGTEHGYALPERDIYDKRAAERDWELIFAMFHRQIPAYRRP